MGKRHKKHFTKENTGTVNKKMKRYSKAFVIKKKKMKMKNYNEILLFHTHKVAMIY